MLEVGWVGLGLDWGGLYVWWDGMGWDGVKVGCRVRVEWGSVGWGGLGGGVIVE